MFMTLENNMDMNTTWIHKLPSPIQTWEKTRTLCFVSCNLVSNLSSMTSFPLLNIILSNLLISFMLVSPP